MPHDTTVDALLADARRQALLDDFAARLTTGSPVRWHRLLHDTLGCQMHASPDLASVTELCWRCRRAGIPVHIVSEWVSFHS